VAAWGALDPDGPLPSIDRPEMRPRWALIAGAAGGVAIAFGSVALHAGVHAGFDAAMRDRDEVLFAFAFWVLSLTLAGQVLAGIIAAVRAVPFATLHGVLAGLVAGLIGTFVEAVARTASSCVPALTLVEGRPCGRPPTVDYILPYLSIVLSVGLTAAAIAAAITGVLRQLAASRGAEVGRARASAP
jgi:hypothetical protein